MAVFKGTKDEFKKYFNGYCRNKVNEIARKERASHNGICEYCQKKAELQSAHVVGFERIKLIDNILDSYFKNDNEYMVNMDEFEIKFIEAHKPVEDHFHFLCSQCHSKYDQGLISEEEMITTKIKNLQEKLNQLRNNSK